MIRRLISFLFILIVLTGLGLGIYAYVSDLPPQVGTVETPAAGVGFDE